MATVSATIALVAKPEVKCDVKIERNKDGEQTWQRFGSIGGVGLPINAGRWRYHEDDKTLYLMDNDLKMIVGDAVSVQSDFLVYVVCGKSLRSSGEILDLHARVYLSATWDFWDGCA